MNLKVKLVLHPSAHVFLTRARDKNTSTEEFANSMRRIGYILAVDVLKDLEVFPVRVTTPLEMTVTGSRFAPGQVALVPVMRAGDILQEGFRAMLDCPLVWHINIRRDEKTLLPQGYGNKVPFRANISPNLDLVVILEVMLATGGSACLAIDIVKSATNKQIKFVCVLASPEGIKHVHEKHPDVDIHVVAIDERLTKQGEFFPPGYIVPGLGDAGDRCFPTS